MKVGLSLPRLVSPVAFAVLAFAGLPVPAAAVLAVILPSLTLELSVSWKTAVVVAGAAVVGQLAFDNQLACLGGSMLRDFCRSRFGTLVYRSPLGQIWSFADQASPLQPLPRLLPRQVTMIRTARFSGERLKVVGQLELESHLPPPASPTLVLEPSVRYQTFLGFGGSFTESSADLLLQMKPVQQEMILEAYFNKETGLAYNWGRLHIGSCDFSKGNWSCLAEPGDTALQSFSIDRYQHAMLPMIRRAEKLAGHPLSLIASPWSPPAWMKDTGSMLTGGTLLPQFRAAWAQHYVRFAQAFKDEGVPLWGFTVQNEPHASTPWENCLYSAEAERDFVRDHLGPALEASELGLKLLIWDHNRDDMFARAHAIYSDPEAAKYVWGIGYHWYGDPRYEAWPAREGMLLHENLRKVHELRPDKHIIMTEACQEFGPRIGSWKLGERYAEAIIKDLDGWLEAWVDWNLILDESGGPNHVNNLVSAPIIADTARGSILFLSSYYYIGHFSRFIKPGAQRISAASNRDGLEVTGFANPDGSVVAVVLNQGDYPVDFWLQINGQSAKTEALAHSISTFIVADAAARVDT
ncbi:unnamed protein product [Polarella glacialis]|uniref:Glucosylceramidase n=1 Tax=Polarella glacialis TaxID=89957 RepID=A0A813K009_POLGL|nr:unnamed protein product [Polarella glacialis]